MSKVLDYQNYMNQALEYAKMSKCASLKVGCIAINERNRVISTGVNGTVTGYHNCNSIWDGPSPEHSEWSQAYEIHAEMNMILELAISSQTFNSITVFVTHSPCSNCLKHLAGLHSMYTKVDKIVYNEKYHGTSDEDLEAQKAYCKGFGIELVSLEELNTRELNTPL